MIPAVPARVVTVFGASGFLGRHVVRELASRGFRIRAACRRPDLAGHLQPLGNVGQIVPIQANVRFRDSIDRAVEGADHVVNLVAILAESGQQTFETVQQRGARWIAEAAAREEAGLVHVSAIGADAGSENGYARTKGEAEQAVFDAVKDAVILRPSILFGPEDDFFNRFAAMARVSPVIPLIGGGKTLLQPAYVGDVAVAVAEGLGGKAKPGTIYEAGGPQVLSFRACMEKMLEVIERRRGFINLPFGIASAVGSLAQYAPGQPLTPGQVDMLRQDNVVSEEAHREGRTLEGLDIQPQSLGAILPYYLIRFRKHGQFEAKRGL